MQAKFVTLWLQVVQPLTNVHEKKWTPHVKRETDVAQSYTSSGHTRRQGQLVSFLVEKMEIFSVSACRLKLQDFRANYMHRGHTDTAFR